MNQTWLYQAARPGSALVEVSQWPVRCVRVARVDVLVRPLRMHLVGPCGCVRAARADVLGRPVQMR